MNLKTHTEHTSRKMGFWHELNCTYPDNLNNGMNFERAKNNSVLDIFPMSMKAERKLRCVFLDILGKMHSPGSSHILGVHYHVCSHLKPFMTCASGSVNSAVSVTINI